MVSAGDAVLWSGLIGGTRVTMMSTIMRGQRNAGSQSLPTSGRQEGAPCGWIPSSGVGLVVGAKRSPWELL